MDSRHWNTRKIFILLLLAFLPGMSVFAVTFVKPGDTVEIPVPIKNADDSADAINAVQVTITGPSNFVTNVTADAADAIPKGTARTLIPKFIINSGAQDGNYSVNVKTIINDVGIDPDPATMTASVDFIIGNPGPGLTLGNIYTNWKGISAFEATTTEDILSVTLFDPEVGLKRISITGPSTFDPVYKEFSSPLKTAYYYLFTDLGENRGRYVIDAIDYLDRPTHVTFNAGALDIKAEVSGIWPGAGQVTPHIDATFGIARIKFDDVTDKSQPPVTLSEAAPFSFPTMGDYVLRAWDSGGNFSNYEMLIGSDTDTGEYLVFQERNFGWLWNNVCTEGTVDGAYIFGSWLRVAFEDVTHEGCLHFSMTSAAMPIGKINPLGAAAIKLTVSDGLLYNGRAFLSIPYSGANLTSEQINSIKAVRIVEEGKTYQELPTTLDATNGKASAVGQLLGTFSLAAQIYNPMYRMEEDDLTFESGEFGVGTRPVPTGSTEAVDIQRKLASEKNMTPVSGMHYISPEDKTFLPEAAVLFKVPQPEPLAAEVYEFNSDLSVFLSLGKQRVEKADGMYYVASVSKLHSYFALLSSGTDTAAPETQLSFTAPPYVNNGITFISSTTRVVLTPEDVYVSGEITSNVATTYYVIDGDTSTAQPLGYGAPFYLSEGRHSVYYGSIDNAGNTEEFKSKIIYVDGTSPEAYVSINSQVVVDTFAYITVKDSVSIVAGDVESNNVISNVSNVFFLLDVSSNSCDGVTFVSTAPAGTCQNYIYTAPFTLGVGTHTVYYSGVDNVGNRATKKMVQLIVSGGPDATPPVTALLINNVAVSSDAAKYVREGSTLTLSASDPVVEGAARSGVALTTYTVAMLIDQNWVPVESDTYTEPMVMKGNEGSYKFNYQSVDAVGNWEALNNRIINVDKTAPVGGVQVNGSSTTDAQGNLVVSADHYISIVSTDPVSNGVASGVKDNYFQVDASPDSCETETTFTGPEGTCQNPRFTTPFTLAVGTHTVYYTAVDNVGNMAEIKNLFLTVSAPAQTILPVSPSSGPIGMPFTITGADFGTYYAGVTTVLVGGASAPLTLWSTTTIKGTIPGTLSAGEQTVVVMRGTSTIANAAPFTVTTPALYTLTPSSGAIGLPFTITGENFGNYVANFTQVLLGGATMPLTLWTDNKIQGTIPGNLAAGEYALVVERALNGGVVRSSSSTFTLSNMQAFWLAPSSGPIGMPFTITGEGFGNYSAALEHVLLGDTTAPLTLWSDTKIQGTVPGSLTSGQYPVVVERRTADGGLMQTSSAMTFEVVTVDVASMTPVAGPIGLPFTIYGANFGNYVANFTKVLIGGTTAPLTLWTSTKIQGTIPGTLADGVYPVVVERELNGGVVTSSALTFEVLGVNIASMTPVAGPIGMPFTIYGGNFGNYAAGYTKVLIGGTTVPLTLWTDTKIQGTIPGGLTDGDYPVLVERALNGGQVQSSTLTWTLNSPAMASVAPSSGPIGLPFTINGANFGNYVANYTTVLIGGATAPLSLWTDTKIQGTVPGSLAAGDYDLVVVRALNGGEVRTSTAGFTVTGPVLGAISPSTAAVIAPFTITGVNFGNYVANYTKVLINGTTAPLTLWTDTKIQGKLPFLLNGTYPVQVQRSLNGGLAETSTAYITVAEPVISSMTPTSGAVGTVFNLYGSGFGPYDASQTRVTIGGVACALSLWTDTNIRGTVPTAISYGTYTVVAMRGQALSNEIEYTVPEAFRVSMMRPVTMLNAEFKLGEIYVYPNPAKGGKVPVFHVEVGLADTVKIKVFSVSGQSVLERTITGVPQAVDGKYAYEYAWEGHIASGVYFYTMEAEQAGKKLKAKGRFAVVR